MGKQSSELASKSYQDMFKQSEIDNAFKNSILTLGYSII
jgi:hypothetical protein